MPAAGAVRLVDTHCHLQSVRFDGDRDEVIARTRETLAWAVVIADDLEASHAAIALAERHDLYAAVGFHPYHAEQATDETLREVEALAAHPRVVAIGEIGLDYFNEYAPRHAQHRAFERQLELACQLQKAVVIHNRESDDDCLGILARFAERLPGCIMHCFGSDAATAARALDLGFYVSFAGNVTFPKAEPLRQAARIVPMDRLLVETDAPYLAPVPLRGKRCEPAFVTETAAFLAQLKGVPLDEFTARTTANAARVYGLSASG